jgi:hypothetical protein
VTQTFEPALPGFPSWLLDCHGQYTLIALGPVAIFVWGEASLEWKTRSVVGAIEDQGG